MINKNNQPTTSNDQWALIRWILEAIENIEVKTTAGRKWSDHLYPRKMMLTLISYSYISGIYESHEIAGKVLSDPTFKYLAAKAEPSALVIREFRRGHMDTIARCIENVFQIAGAQGCFPEALLRNPADTVDGQLLSEGNWLKYFAETAQDRINTSIIMDTCGVEV